MKLKYVRVDSYDGEIHFILQNEPQVSENPQEPNLFDEIEAVKITKREAQRQLLLIHA